MIKRVISWIIMVVVAIPIIFAGGEIYNIVIALIALLATNELIKVRKKKKDIPFIMQLLTYFFVLMLLGLNLNNTAFDINLNYFIALVLTFFLPLVFYHESKKYQFNDALYLIGTILLVGVAASLFILFRNMRMAYIVYVLLISVATDTFAYAGIFIGKHKLTPISPKKSWEGTIYGTFMATVIASLFYVNVIDSNINLLTLVSVTLFISIISQFGDLIFSVIKREYKIKDYGNLIPGHGGVLDRIDSVIFALLAFALILPFL